MNQNTLVSLASSFVAMLFLNGCTQPSSAQDDAEAYQPGLALQMHYMQLWTHKLALSIEAENEALAVFYHHELEETAEDIITTIEEYDGYAIADLTRAMLVPPLERLEEILDSGDWSGIRVRFDGLVQSCNGCHSASDHAYIRITSGFGNNPYNQDFSRQ